MVNPADGCKVRTRFHFLKSQWTVRTADGSIFQLIILLHLNKHQFNETSFHVSFHSHQQKTISHRHHWISSYLPIGWWTRWLSAIQVFLTPQPCYCWSIVQGWNGLTGRVPKVVWKEMLCICVGSCPCAQPFGRINPASVGLSLPARSSTVASESGLIRNKQSHQPWTVRGEVG